MNTFKKLFALALALALTLSLAVPAMAEEHQHTIKILETATGHKYMAYQIFKGHVFSGDQDGDDTTTANDQVLKDVEWGSNVDWDANVSWKIGDQTVQLNMIQVLQHPTLNHAYYTYYAGIPSAISIPDTEGYNPDFDDDDEIASAVAKALASKNEAAHANAFAKIVSKYLTGTGTVSSPVPATGTITHYEINNLSDGYYLVKDEQAVDGETMTDYIMQLVADVEVEPKDGAVGVEKYILEGQVPVKQCSNTMGEEITFWVEGTLPGNLAEFKNFYYEFVDTMASGLVYVNDSVKVYTVNGDTAKQIVNPENEIPYYTVSQSGTSLKVVFADLKRLTDAAGYTVRSTTKIRLEYKAKLDYIKNPDNTSNSIVVGGHGNKNEAYIKFSHNPYDYDAAGTKTVKTSTSAVHVFTFQLDVHKIDGRMGTKLQDIGFVLYREREGKLQYAVVTPDKTTVHTATGTTPSVTHTNSGYIKGWTDWRTVDELEKYMQSNDQYNSLTDEEYNTAKAQLLVNPGVASTLTTDDTGLLNIKGLDLADLYWLMETEKPDYYDAIDPVKMTLTATYDSTDNAVDNLKITIDNVPANGNNDSGKVSTTVVNNPGNTLPSTGGMGTTVFYIVGAILVLGAMVLLVTKKRMEN